MNIRDIARLADVFIYELRESGELEEMLKKYELID